MLEDPTRNSTLKITEKAFIPIWQIVEGTIDACLGGKRKEICGLI